MIICVNLHTQVAGFANLMVKQTHHWIWGHTMFNPDETSKQRDRDTWKTKTGKSIKHIW